MSGRPRGLLWEWGVKNDLYITLPPRAHSDISTATDVQPKIIAPVGSRYLGGDTPRDQRGQDRGNLAAAAL